MSNHTHIQETKPLVSFIIPYYQLPVQMLKECIESILRLSLRPFECEIIVIDDGSEESPINELLAYEDNIIYVRQKHSGVSMARNKGLDMAKGQYIQFVDADDLLIQAPYEQCLDIIRYQDQVDMVLFDFTHRPQTELETETFLPVSGTSYMRNNNIHGAAWSYLFHRSILGELRFSPGIHYGEDEEFTAQIILRAEKLYPTTYKAYYYRQHEVSAVHQNDTSKVQQRLNDTHYVIRNLNMLSDKMAHTDKIALQRRIAQLTMDYLYNTIVITRSKKELDQRIQELYAEGLFPLSDINYSTKYTWFRRMANSSFGRSVLLHTLPLMKKER